MVKSHINPEKSKRLDSCVYLLLSSSYDGWSILISLLAAKNSGWLAYVMLYIAEARNPVSRCPAMKSSMNLYLSLVLSCLMIKQVNVNKLVNLCPLLACDCRELSKKEKTTTKDIDMKHKFSLPTIVSSNKVHDI